MTSTRDKIDDFTNFESGLNGWSSIQGSHVIKKEDTNNYVGFVSVGGRRPHFHLEKDFTVPMKFKISFRMRITKGAPISSFFVGNNPLTYLDPVPVNDGEWHTYQAEWTSTSGPIKSITLGADVPSDAPADMNIDFDDISIQEQ